MPTAYAEAFAITSSPTFSACSSASCKKIQSSRGNWMVVGSFFTFSQSVLCHISRVVSPVFWILQTLSYLISWYARNPPLILFFPAFLSTIASVTPSSRACVAPCALVGKKGCAESPSRQMRPCPDAVPYPETQFGSGSRYTSFQSTSLSSGVFEIIFVHIGSQSRRTSFTSESLPGKDQDSSMSCSSRWVKTQQQSLPFFKVLKRKCTSGPV